MDSPLRNYFDILVRHETELWNRVEKRTSAADTVNLARFEILNVIAATPLCRIQDVTERLRITVGATSRLADRMEVDGLVRRYAHPTDGRSSIIEITDRGRAALTTTELAIDRSLDELMGDLDPNELAVLTAFLTRAHALLTATEGVNAGI